MRKLTIVLAATAISLAAGVAVVGAAQAHSGCSDDNGKQGLSAEQAQKVDQLRETYGAELETLAARTRTTARDLDRALAEGDTARADELRQELEQARTDLAAVRDRLLADAREAGVAGPWVMMLGWDCPMMGGKAGTGMMMGQGSMMKGHGPGMMMGRHAMNQQGAATATPCE